MDLMFLHSNHSFSEDFSHNLALSEEIERERKKQNEIAHKVESDSSKRAEMLSQTINEEKHAISKIRVLLT